MTAPFRELFYRHPGNPIITAADLPYRANSVFNPGATLIDGETLLLIRVEDRRGHSHLTAARSKDGIGDWRFDPAPTFMADPDLYPEEIWGVEDPRITYVEEEKQWVIAYTAFSVGGPLVALATTKDFRTFTRLGPVMPPDDKDAALFPIRFGGRWAMLHRPASTDAATGAQSGCRGRRICATGATTTSCSGRAAAAGGTPTRSACRRRRCAPTRAGFSSTTASA